MRNKLSVFNSRFPAFCGMLWGLLLAGCTSGSVELPDTVPDVGPDKGEPVTLTFDMYSATVTRADAEDTSPKDMEIGKQFRIYAFTAGSTSLSAPLDSRIYTVQPDETTSSLPGKATGNLTLYRGNYDLYLVSYNSSTEVPSMNADGTLTVNNGKDFMYTKLENIVVQPDKTGQNTMLVSLPRPFTRLGAQVITTVKTAERQPVTVNAFIANYITISGLPKELAYKLNNTVWETPSANAPTAEPFQFSTFTGNNQPENTGVRRESEARVVLPVDGTTPLSFDVNLTVTYFDNSVKKTTTSSYKASIHKALLPGMTYQFDFTLTFYGEIIPADLTLALREWTTITLNANDMGK